jgi:hypothetical protein
MYQALNIQIGTDRGGAIKTGKYQGGVFIGLNRQGHIEAVNRVKIDLVISGILLIFALNQTFMYYSFDKMGYHNAVRVQGDEDLGMYKVDCKESHLYLLVKRGYVLAVSPKERKMDLWVKRAHEEKEKTVDYLLDKIDSAEYELDVMRKVWE